MLRDDGITPYHTNEEGLMDDPRELRELAHTHWRILVDMLCTKEGAAGLIRAYGSARAAFIVTSLEQVHACVCESCTQEQKQEQFEEMSYTEAPPEAQKGGLNTWLRVQSHLYAGHPLQN